MTSNKGGHQGEEEKAWNNMEMLLKQLSLFSVLRKPDENS